MKRFAIILMAMFLGPAAHSVSIRAQAGEPEEEKSATAAKDESPNGPEFAVKGMLLAVMVGNEKELRRWSVPHRDLAILLEGERVPRELEADLREQVKTAPFKRLKPGDTLELPSGRSLKIDEQQVNERRQLVDLDLGSDESPFPFVVVKHDGQWKVDLSLIIAVRKNVAALREKGVVGSEGEFPRPKPERLLELGEPVRIGDYTIRPPLGYEPYEQKQPRGTNYIWSGPMREERTRPTLMVTIAALNDEEKKTSLESHLRGSMVGIHNCFDDFKVSEIERGDINGLSFVRQSWSGTARASSKQNVEGRQVHGLNYVAVHGSVVIAASFVDVDPHHEETLPVLNASIATLERTK